ncbi:cold shock domain-containing protein [Rhodococcus sp. WB9]|uniref:cold shock domain-containing protein n=1 Tax=Rhodococcus sp. WB9 TaxID=2594007 RepID=UPI001186B2B8|nr:cold shock domain-containing protein [Rhodococcus sp. WB9]QDQ92725.1 cold shock domain-containing protein [Rhodococcus sp. WB9]
MRTKGIVRSWNHDEGWGVIDSVETPGGCWIHYGKVAVERFRGLVPGQQLELEFENLGQDGFDYRAVRAWPVGEEPYDRYASSRGNSRAFETSLTIVFDDEDESPGDRT